MSKRSYFNCCVFGCLNSTRNRDELSFFKLPKKGERRTEWLKIINREDLIDQVARHCRVCEVHFNCEDILASANRKVLKQKTIPRLMLPYKKFESTGTQASVCMTPKLTQTSLFTCCVHTQTPKWMLKAIHNSEVQSLKQELQDCKKTLRIKTQTEFGDFLKLCDKYLEENFSNIVKEKAKQRQLVKANMLRLNMVTADEVHIKSEEMEEMDECDDSQS